MAVLGLGQVELEQQVPDMALDRALANDQAAGDGGVVEAFSASVLVRARSAQVAGPAGPTVTVR